MITLRTEFKKIKRKKIGLTMCALIGVQFAWLLWSGSHPNENERLQGWIEMLHSLPLISVIMMPTIMSVLASRLADVEHKGNTYKLLNTLRRPGALYHAKVVCGALFILAISTAQFLFVIALGYARGYAGHPEWKYYGTTFVLNLACCLSLYLLQLLLSMLFFNQMIPLVAGLGGSMLGLILMYIKMYSFLPWGGFLSAAQVNMDWNPETRIIHFYYREYSPVELCAVSMIFIWIVVFYTAGRLFFTRKEA
ncbi:MAG: ABC transporter permease [Lachnospiraceae bacterium]|nr:ABC transporter permease [Lachnospiraceae bacterium]